MICVGYSKRASCDPNMGLLSLKEQNDRIREYASSKGWKLSSFYEDRSDSPEGDNGFQKLREAGLRREFDVLQYMLDFQF
jgi:DNA invertase Pin-like site-specific DNA recombinase